MSNIARKLGVRLLAPDAVPNGKLLPTLRSDLLSQDFWSALKILRSCQPSRRHVTEENNLQQQTEYQFMQIFFLVNAKLKPATKNQAPASREISLPSL